MQEFMPTIRTGFCPRADISHVVFDFDGTLSWLRHGWPAIMCEVFLERIPLKPDEARDTLAQRLLEDILSLNGKPSIFQMQLCLRQAEQRGASLLDVQELLQVYHGRLAGTIQERKEQLGQGRAVPDDFIVHGARALLENLHDRGLVLIILSGTAEPQVKEEADLLDLTRYFGRHIYGGTSDLAQSSKQAVLERVLRQENIAGRQLLAFGDGPVEIALTKAVGGLAVGVASDEERNGSGQMHPVKLNQLSQAGADVLIPDYREPDALLECLLGN
jgi:phosphoglycolate phosphatase-like HAD superfamily hydrolase